MKKWLKRIRGAVGMGLTWAIAWSGVGAILGLVSGVIFGGGFIDVFPGFFIGGMAGFIGGGAFSVVLGIAEGRRTFEEMSLPRFAGWGAVGGLLLFVLLGGGVGAFTLRAAIGAAALTLMGAGSAAGSLALARRADDGELLEAGDSAGLIEGE